MRLRAIFPICAVSCASTPQPRPSVPPTALAQGWIDADARASDLAFLCETVRDAYVYANASVGAWSDCEEVWGTAAREAVTKAGFLHVVEGAITSLHDHHAGVGTHTDGSPVPVPTRADLWLETVGDDVVITAVRPNSVAAEAGLRVGTRVTEIDGVPMDAFETDVARRAAAAGARGQEVRRLRIGADGSTLELPPVRAPEYSALLSTRRVGSVGVIRIHNALGRPELVPAFDEALEQLADTTALILDLRDTPSGGDTDVAEPIMGRFVAEEAPYQRLAWTVSAGERRAPRGMLALVLPRPDLPTVQGPLVVLVSRWTGSMGEGMAVGLHALGRATVVGTSMAGLAGAVESFTMPASQVSFQIPVGTIHTMDGTPRESWTPPVLVDLTTAQGDDPIFDAGLAALP
ncbi:MAG: S41 family peptidase [Nannocystaceae bacterium]|nr:S41 family peptidase [bacterium]